MSTNPNRGKPYGERIEEALALISEASHIDGRHHRQWYLDQIVRTLCDARPDDQDDYLAFVAAFENGEDGPRWDTGIAP